MNKPKTLDDIHKQANSIFILLLFVLSLFFLFTVRFIEIKFNQLETKVQCVEGKNTCKLTLFVVY